MQTAVKPARVGGTGLVLLCAITYFVSYITRINYGAVLLAMKEGTGFSSEELSLAVTGLSVFYGTGQLLSGYLGDRFKPRLLIGGGLLVTSAMNLLIPLCPTIPAITAVWCVNGLAQAMMWPPIVKILSASFSPETYKKANIKVSYGSALGTVAVYALSPVFIRFFGWQSVFLISGVSAVIMALVVFAKMPDVALTPASVGNHSPGDSASAGQKERLPVGLLLILVPIVSQGLLRDGVQTWMPSYVKEVFHLDSEIAILTCVAMPLFSIVCYELASLINRKWLRNELVCAGCIFAVGLCAALFLGLFYGSSVAVSVALSTLLVGCMHGVNLILNCVVPVYFVRTGRVSFVSGLLNSVTYLGSALSGYGFAALSTRFGWGFTVMGWAVVCGIALLFCLLTAKSWQNYKER